MAELGSVLGGRYRLDQVLGQGGMATIFRATDAKLGREVAVKVLRPEFGRDPEFVARFTDEARAAASLNHPNIVAVHDVGMDPAGPFIVMEQVAGGDLSVALGERGVLPPTAVARTGQQVADALAAAHARGLVHRDIKPGNILLSPDGRVQVADFGIAQMAAGAPLTSSGLTLGSVLYFSPEQARGDVATAASDVYSLGLVMYELLTGRRAFAGDSPAAVAVARLSGGVPSPMAVRPDTPPALDAIVRWCLAIDPGARPTAAELSAALARFIADPSGVAYGTPIAAGAVAAGVPDGASNSNVLAPDGRSRAISGERPGSGPWAWLAAALGLLVIIASGILLFVLFSGIGVPSPSPSPRPTTTPQLVRMPDFVGRTESRALKLADQVGLALEIEYVESEGRPGRVVAQLPDPKMEIPAGTSVTIRVATRSETVVVPDVQGLSEADAVQRLEAAGLRPGERSRADDPLPEGYVISTDPRVGDELTRASVVDYVVSTGRGSGTAADASQRPSVSGDIESASVPSASSPAASALESAGGTAAPSATAGPPGSSEPTAGGAGQETPAAAESLATSATPVADESQPASSASPPGAEVSASPAGVEASPGAPPSALPSDAVASPPEASGVPAVTATPAETSAVTSPLPSASSSAVAGTSPTPFPSEELVLVGDFRCLDLATARGHIEEAGLLVGQTIHSVPTPGDDWLVQAQLPDAGEYLPPGSNVDLVLADPLEPCPAG